MMSLYWLCCFLLGVTAYEAGHMWAAPEHYQSTTLPSRFCVETGLLCGDAR